MRLLTEAMAYKERHTLHLKIYHLPVTLESLLLPLLSPVSLCVRWDADNAD